MYISKIILLGFFISKFNLVIILILANVLKIKSKTNDVYGQTIDYIRNGGINCSVLLTTVADKRSQARVTLHVHR